MLLVSTVFSLLLWLAISLISHGLTTTIVQQITSFFPPQLADFLLIQNIQYGFHYPVDNPLMPTRVYLVIYSILFLIYLLTIYLIPKKSDRKNFGVIILGAILFRMMLLPSIPIHENDMYRYLWDGKVFKAGMNPYQYPPGYLESLQNEFDVDYYDLDLHSYVAAKVFTDDELKGLAKLAQIREDNKQTFHRIGHRWVPTIYPPVAQLTFLLSAIIKADSVLIMKTIFVLFDLGVIFFILKLLRYFRQPREWIIIYAWNPLVLKEFANSGHYDVVAIFFSLFAIYAISKNRQWLAAVGFAAGALTKFFPLFFIPLFFRRLGWKYSIITGVLFSFGLGVFMIWSSVGLGVFTGLRIYSELWKFNPSVFYLLQLTFDQFQLFQNNPIVIGKIICATFFIASLGWLSSKRIEEMDVLKGCGMAMLLLFLFNPAGYPWYYTWCLPFLCFWRSFAAILLSGLLMFSYLVFNHVIDPVILWEIEIERLFFIQYGIFAIIFIVEIIFKKVKYVPRA